MIRVVRIAGEGYDLDTGEAYPKSLVLSNGYREVFLPVDDQTVRDIIALAVENEPFREPKERRPPAEFGSGNPPKPAETQEGISDSVAVRLRPAPEELPDEPVVEAYEPGEEYSDPATGVMSL